MKHPDIKLEAVESTNVAAIGHQGSTLAVRFKSGGTYHYDGVSEKKYQELLGAKSIGSAMGGIKANHKCKAID